MSETLKIATRQSKLALWQANFIRDELKAAHPGIEVELVGMTTKGDRWLDSPLSEVGGKGLFVKELEAAMLAGAADIAVHSAKDLPAALPEPFDLPVIAYRAATEDVLISPHGDLAALPDGAKVGSSSLRRRAQLLALRDDLEVAPIRGNVDTRLGKLAAGEFDAIVLAAAGLDRLGLDVPGRYELDPASFVAAPGQGALAIECVRDSPAQNYLKALADRDVYRCVSAERGISLGLGADCSLPVAASARIADNDDVILEALISDADGKRILRTSGQGPEPEALAAELVQQLFAAGAQDILDQLALS